MAKLPDMDTFLFLPEDLVAEIGPRTHQGARLELALLSCLAYFYKKNLGQETSYTASGGVRIEAGKRDFVLSINTIAANLYFRWFLKLPSDDHYQEFYERVRASAKRLKARGYLKYKRPAAGGRNYRYGSVWTLDGTPLQGVAEDLPVCYGTGLLLSRVPDSTFSQRGLVNAVDLVGGALSSESYVPFRFGEYMTSVHDRGHFTDHYEWHKAIAAKGSGGERFCSVGAYQKKHTHHTYEAPAYMVYVNHDFDEPDLLDNYRYAREATEEYLDAGVGAEDIIVGPTSGRGVHVHLKGGVLGNPVFRHPMEAVRTLSYFTEHLSGAVDKRCFDPRQPIRMVGSRHKQGGFKLAYSADEFLRGNPYEQIGASNEYRGRSLERPDRADPNPLLIERLIDAATRARLDRYDDMGLSDPTEFAMRDFDQVDEFDPNKKGGGAFAAAMDKGVSEGEEWYEPRGYSGRDMRMFIIALGLVGQGKSDYEVQQIMESENLKNNPPLPSRVLTQKVRSALRTHTPPA